VCQARERVRRRRAGHGGLTRQLARSGDCLVCDAGYQPARGAYSEPCGHPAHFARAGADLAARAARRIGLTPRPYTRLTAELMEDGLLVEVGLLPKKTPSAGRPRILVDLNAGGRVAVAAQIGIRHLEVGLIDLRARVVARHLEDLSLEGPPERLLSRIGELAHGLLRQLGLDPDLVVGMGFSVAGQWTRPAASCGSTRAAGATSAERASERQFGIPVRWTRGPSGCARRAGRPRSGLHLLGNSMPRTSSRWTGDGWGDLPRRTMPTACSPTLSWPGGPGCSCGSVASSSPWPPTVFVVSQAFLHLRAHP